MAIGIAVAAILVLLAVMGASAQHDAGAARLERGAASIVLSVLATLAGLAGAAVLVLLLWTVTAGRRRTPGAAGSRRRSPILVAVAACAILVLLLGLVALAARHRQSLSPGLIGPGPRASSHIGGDLPFNATASLATVGAVVGLLGVLAAAGLLGSLSWRRAQRHHQDWPVDPPDADEPRAGDEGALEVLGSDLAAVRIPRPDEEPDPRKAVVSCYLAMLDAATRSGLERRRDETASEYLGRLLEVVGVSAPAASALTALFERARYSGQAVGEEMRSRAIRALGDITSELAASRPELVTR